MQTRPKTRFFAASFLGVLLLAGAGCFGGVEPTLTLSATTFEAGDTVSVSFTAPADYDSSAWVGIIPSDIAHGDESVNDQFDLSYKYLENQESGVLVFTAPSEPGQYDFRMHDTDSGGVEVASVSFTVTAPAVTVEPTLSLEQTTFAAGDDVVVSFTAPRTYDASAWVGVIPSDTAHGDESVNDEVDLSYEYLNNRESGTLTFTAPDEAGSYDLRMHDTDSGGTEVASVTFTVE